MTAEILSSLRIVPLTSVLLPEQEQRQYYDQDKILELAESIRYPTPTKADPDAQAGIINAITVVEDSDGKLWKETGGRRYRALKAIMMTQGFIYYQGSRLQPKYIPVLVSKREDLSGYRENIRELDENVKRQDLTPAEEASARKKLADLKAEVFNEVLRQKREREKITPAEPIVHPALRLNTLSPVVLKSVAKELNLPSTPESQKVLETQIKAAEILEKTAEELSPDEKIVQKQLKSAKTQNELLKVMKSADQRQQHRELAAKHGGVAAAEKHKIFHGDFNQICLDFKSRSFDIALCDPPYGINANNFGDAAGRMVGQVHNYDDSYAHWQVLTKQLMTIYSSLLRKDAVMYIACDQRNFAELKQILSEVRDGEWKIWQSPIIQVRQAGGRVPWKDQGFRRSFDCWLFAQRGNRKLHNIVSDVFMSQSDRSDQYGANKPVQVLQDLLATVAVPGDKVLDLCAGTGSALVAAHRLGCEATLVEIADEQYGRCLERLQTLTKY